MRPRAPARKHEFLTRIKGGRLAGPQELLGLLPAQSHTIKTFGAIDDYLETQRRLRTRRESD